MTMSLAIYGEIDETYTRVTITDLHVARRRIILPARRSDCMLAPAGPPE
jgi:hypothetical protein